MYDTADLSKNRSLKFLASIETNPRRQTYKSWNTFAKPANVEKKLHTFEL